MTNIPKKIFSAEQRRRLDSLKKKIEKEKDNIAQARDRLREYSEEIDDIADCADHAIHELEHATDRLSWYL